MRGLRFAAVAALCALVALADVAVAQDPSPRPFGTLSDPGTALICRLLRPFTMLGGAAPLEGACRWPILVHSATPEPSPGSSIRLAREALECDLGRAHHDRRSTFAGVAPGNDPRQTMQSTVRSGSVVPWRGYQRLERDDDAVLYGYGSNGEIKVAVRVVRAADGWRPDGMSRCQLAEFGRADMGPGVWLWTNKAGRAIQERRGSAHCGNQSMRVLYVTTPGKPETLRNTRLYARDPEGVVRDQWKAPYLRSTKLPSDVRFTGYRRDGAALWMAADGDSIYIERGNVVERWPRVWGDVGCV